MFGSQTRPGAQVGSSTREQPKNSSSTDQADRKPLRPTEPVWKTTEPPHSAAPSPPEGEVKSQAHSSEADLRTLIIGPGVSVKGEITSCNRLIVEGKIEKFFQSYCLVDQGFVKKNSEISVKEHIATVSKQLGDEISIRRFVRFQVGEAIAA